MNASSNFPQRQTGSGIPSAENVGRVQALNRVLANPNLTSPPTLALEIVKLTSQPDCEVEQVCELLQTDPALCGKLLKIVNSVMYSPTHPIGSPQRAVTILGLNPLRSIVLALSLPAMQAGQEATPGLANYWKTSLSGAILARELSRKLGSFTPDEDFVTGLLRDLGMLLLQQCFPEEYRPLWESQDVTLSNQCEWEYGQFGLDHAEVGAGLLQSWGLPPEIVEPIRAHHGVEPNHPDRPMIATRTKLLRFTTQLARLEEISKSPDELNSLLNCARDEFSLTRSQLEEFLALSEPQIEELAAILQIQIGACPQFATVLASGCEELIRLSMSNTANGAAARSLSGNSTMTGRLENSISRPGLSSMAGPVEEFADGDTNFVNPEDFLADLERPGTKARIQNFEIEGPIGRGAMGAVFKATDLQLHRSVALKFLLPGQANCQKSRERFLREARAVAAIRHEHVVAIHGVSEIHRLPYLVMEYISGMSIEDWLEAGRTFSVSEVVAIGQQIAAGLAAAHKIRLIHRDIKPANVLLEGGSERVRITDFGLARALDERSNVSHDGQLTGTPYFMSPEQVIGAKLTPSSDLFSLGSLLYRLCTGRLPFEGDSLFAVLTGVASHDRPTVQSLNPLIPQWLNDVIEQLHAKKPENRFPSAQALADFLDAHADSQVASTHQDGSASATDFESDTKTLRLLQTAIVPRSEILADAVSSPLLLAPTDRLNETIEWR